MINATSKKLKHAEIGDSVLIPISRPDMISSIGPRNLSGCITHKEDHLYTIGTTEGILGVKYTMGQFDVCNSNSLTPRKIPSHTITETEAMQKASLGIE